MTRVTKKYLYYIHRGKEKTACNIATLQQFVCKKRFVFMRSSMLQCCNVASVFWGSNLVGKRGCFSGSDLIFCSMLTEDEHSLDCFNEDDAGFPNNHDFLLENLLIVCK